MANRTKNGQKLSDLAREHTEEAFNFLLATMQDTTVDMKVRVGCAKEILDRGNGRATQVINHTQRHEIEHKATFDFSKLTKEAKRQLVEAHIDYEEVETLEGIEIKHDPEALPKPTSK